MSDKWAVKIRALLAQAESTTHEEEAATFLAKAQELMLRFAIDEEELAKADPIRKSRPMTKTIEFGKFGAGIKAKRILITGIADINRCKVWMHGGRRYLSVAGYEEDVNFSEMLFLSVLVQMESACSTAVVNRPPGENASSFRTSFMYAYVSRVLKRLRESQRSNEQAVPGAALVLRDRRKEVDAYVTSTVGNLGSGPKAKHRGSYGGSVAGDAAGRRADVSGGRRNLGQRNALKGQ